VLDDLDGRIDALIDSGNTRHGVESTVLDPTQSPMVIYRPGAITAAQIHEITGKQVEVFQSGESRNPGEGLPSPGVGLRHYAPRAKLILVDAELSELPARLAEAAASRHKERLGLMLPREMADTHFDAPLRAATVFAWGHWHAPEELASCLYAGLRALDAQGCTVILCPLPPAIGIGEAIRDRLRKAAIAAEE
jgi:L-threonylcarbamoyladenylate synthase